MKPLLGKVAALTPGGLKGVHGPLQRGDLSMPTDIQDKIETASIWWDQIQAPIPFYLIRGEFTALIDTGPPQPSAAAMISALGALGLKPEDVSLILHTHGHDDHTGGNVFLRKTGKTQVAIHGEDAFYLEDRQRAFAEFYGIAAFALGDEQRFREERKAFLAQPAPRSAPDVLLQDGQIVMTGNKTRLRVVGLPGHTKGSVGFYWEEEGLLVAGDAIQGLAGPMGSLPLISDPQAYERSIDRLQQIAPRTLVFTHGYRGKRLPPATIRRRPDIEAYLADSREVAQKLTEALSRKASACGHKPLTEIADEVIGELPAEMGFAPLARQVTPQFSLSTIYWGLHGCLQAANG